MVFDFHKHRRARTLKKCAAMRAAKEKKRLAEAERADWCGAVLFVGPMFGGGHWLDLRARGEERRLLVEIDGQPFRPLTARGLRGLLAKRLLQVGPTGSPAIPR